ncbi:MAG: T9SS type A sorting domain-containing protein [candidate division WOR-3 bacterium]|nr:MAG: T9SS type A sorting domain-containing protein [candidate division WOR-3 bacterium]
MILLLILTLSLGQDNILITESTPSTAAFRVEFSEYKRNEQLPITRFVMTETRPICEYEITEFDSSHAVRDLEETAPVTIGEPVKIKNVTLYPIRIKPSFINNNSKQFIKSANIRVDFSPPARTLELNPSMSSVFEHLVLNFTSTGDPRPRGYLIITPSEFVEEIEPLAIWKEKKGWDVEIRTTAQTGSTPAQIRDYIADAYNTWSPQPEYALLIGDVNHIPAFTNPSATDHPYTLLQGDDFFSELLIGRLSVSMESELNTVVAKIIGYETNPTMSDPSWYSRALMVGANLPGNMTTPIPTKRWVKDRFFDYGFNAVDTAFDPMPPSLITSSVNNGVAFVNYRSGDGDIGGWPWPTFYNTDVYALSNGWKLPVVTSIVCWTGNFAGNCFGEAWLRAGNPVAPKGAVAFFGASSPQSHSRWNNCLDYGIYWAVLKEHMYNLGAALYRGKMEVFLNFPDDTTIATGSSFYFHAFNLLGDPSIDVWTGIPDSFIVTHPSSVPTGANSFAVHVTDDGSQPVSGAMVSLYKENEVKEIQFTDASGNADFNFATSTPDTLFVTITKHNFKPYTGFASVNNSAVYVGHYSHTIDDAGGNNNGQVNPGEPIGLNVTLKNYGTSTTATGISARLSTEDEHVTITDSVESYPNIAPGATATASPFAFNVASETRNGHILKFDLDITSAQGSWSGSIWITVRAPNIIYKWNQVMDGNGILEPGETRDFMLCIENNGGLEASNTSGTLRSANSGLIVTDSAGFFGNIAAADSATNSSNYFTLAANANLTPGTSVRFALIVTGDNGFVDTTGFRLTIGIVDTNEPLGPDDYGYYAYDNTDTDYPEAPNYSWVEIDPAYGGPGDTIGLAADETKTVSLPFNFKYYGNWYDRVSISSDGYIAMDSTDVADMYNWHIPAAGGPPLLIAPFWDDLDPNATDSSGNVCYWYDASGHRFIVEHSRIQHIHDPTNPTPSELQTFEVILYDPQYYSTLTGDGEIVFQYMDITNDDGWHNYATTGIEDYHHTTGIEYTYANDYPPAAAPLTNGRAIKFTTDPPDTFTGVSELKTTAGHKNILNISPNPSKQLTDIRYQITDIRNAGLRIYDVAGRMVEDLTNQLSVFGQPSSVSWDRTDVAGRRLPAGIYFVVLQEDSSSISRKIVLVD